MRDLKIKKILLVAFFILGINSCASTDPTVSDLKSPCASSEDAPGAFGMSPCIKRKPLENYIA